MLYFYDQQVDISSSSPYMILFEGTIANPSNSSIEIDDVALNAGQCLKPPTTFACGDGTSIQPNKVRVYLKCVVVQLWHAWMGIVKVGWSCG
jgi:hypothetical protein